MGLAGLAAGLTFVAERGVEQIRRDEQQLTAQLIAGLREIPGLRLLGSGDVARQTAIVSFNIDGFSCSEVAQALEEQADICCRAGLHCAPLAHQQLGTYPTGAVRFSLGAFNTEEEIARVLEAVSQPRGSKEDSRETS